MGRWHDIKCKECGKEAHTRNQYYCSMECRDKSEDWRQGVAKALVGKSYPKKCKALDQNRKLRKFGPEWRRKIGEAHTGEKNAGYTTGITAYRRLAFKHKHKQCEICYHSDKRLLVHHLDGNRNHNVVENLQVLCYGCHGKMHGSERSERMKGRIITWGDKISKTRIERGIARGVNNPNWKGGLSLRN